MEQARIHAIACMAPAGPVPGFEIGPLEELRGRAPEGILERFNRVDFHTLTLITEGRGEHTVDFTTYDCTPGTLLWVRPGQVQRFGPRGKLKGVHLRFAPAFPGTVTLPAPWHSPVSHRADTTTLAALTTEYTRLPPSPEALRHLLATTLLNLDPHPRNTPYTRFRTALETSYATHHRVDHYAALLGATPRTLTRACKSATGRTAKEIIDARIALQARRLLAHTEQPISAIAHALGFAEPTNFSKFFTRITGMAPGDFRGVHA